MPRTTLLCRGQGQYGRAAVLTVARPQAVPIPARRVPQAPLAWAQQDSFTKPAQDRYATSTVTATHTHVLFYYTCTQTWVGHPQLEQVLLQV